MSHTDLGLVDELRNKDFRDQFFRSERELDIPAQIKALRTLRGLNQEDLAELTGTKQSAISRLERSTQTNWNLETLVKISEALDARLSILIEPFETVVARYRAEQSSLERSAATAQAQVRPESTAPKEPEIAKQRLHPLGQLLQAESDQRRGASWT